MIRCPHCKSEGIAPGARSTFGVFRLTRCAHCGGLSRASWGAKALSGVFGYAVFLAGACWAFWTGSWWPLVAATGLYAIVHFAVLCWSPPVAVFERTEGSG